MKKIDEQIQFFQEYCKNIRRLSNNTIDNRKYCFKDMLRVVHIERLEDLSNKDIDSWITSQTMRGFRAETINVRILALLALIHFYSDRGVKFEKLNERLIKKVSKEPVNRVYYSREQIGKVLDVSNEKQWLLISMCFECGFRIFEITNLRRRDIQDNKIVFVGKGNKLREVYISDKTKKKLGTYIKKNSIQDYLFPSKINKGRPISIPYVRQLMREPFLKCGFDNFHPHSLRHSFATNICNNGAPLLVASKMLGHSSVTITERYVHSFDGRLREYFDKYSLATS